MAYFNDIRLFVQNIGDREDFTNIQRTKNRVYNATLSFLTIGLFLTLATNVIEMNWSNFDNVIYVGGFSMLTSCFIFNYYKKQVLSIIVLTLGAGMILFIMTCMRGDMFLSAIINLLLLSLIFTLIDSHKLIIAIVIIQLLMVVSSILIANSGQIEYHILNYNPVIRVILFCICFLLLAVSLIYSRKQLSFAVSENDHLLAEMKKKNIELKSAYDEMERFSYVVSHDLKAPLRGINSFAQLMSLNIKKENYQKVKESATYVTENATKLSEMIDEILTYSKLNNSEKDLNTLININDIIENIKKELTQYKNAYEVEYGDLGSVYGSKMKIKMVFQNLIDNGIKYNKSDVPKVSIKMIKKPGYIYYDIVDNGIGIKKEDYSDAFALFKRIHTNSEYEGTGVGLANTKRIIENHLQGQSELWITHQEGLSLKFKFPTKTDLKYNSLTEYFLMDRTLSV